MTDREPGRAGKPPGLPNPTGPSKPNGRLAFGLMQIAIGRPAGFAQFGASGEAFLASLAPWLGLLVVMSGTLAWSGKPGLGLGLFLVGLCHLLAPAVIADGFCRMWDRRQHWALYANVLNCGQWLMLALIVMLLPVVTLAVAAGLSQQSVVVLLMVLLTGYAVWFHWFVARHALQLSRMRAAGVMVGVLVGTALLAHLPAAVAGRSALDGLPGTVSATPATP